MPTLKRTAGVAHAQALGDEGLRPAQLLLRYDRPASTGAPSRCRRREAGARAFADEVALELPKGGEQVEHQPPAGCGGALLTS